MVPLLEDDLSARQEVCKKHHVRLLFVFGSALDEQLFSQNSDIDFLYEIDLEEFKDWDTGNYDYIDNHNYLEHKLSQLLSREIDLVPCRKIHNRYFKKVVDDTRQLIYGYQ